VAQISRLKGVLYFFVIGKLFVFFDESTLYPIQRGFKITAVSYSGDFESLLKPTARMYQTVE
jgi:hypothetical protein